jgi:hypothetical protein
MKEPMATMTRPLPRRGALVLTALVAGIIVVGLVYLLVLAPVGPPSHLPDTTTNIHIALPFNYNISSLSNERGKVDLVIGSGWATEPVGVLNTYYYPYERDQSCDVPPHCQTLAWWKAHHPDWIEYRCDRSTPAYEFEDPNVPLDIANPAVLNWMMQIYLAPALQAGYQGIAFDNVSLTNDKGQRCGHYSPRGSWVQQYSGASMDPAYQRTVLAWAHTMSSRIHREFPGKVVAMNFEFVGALPSESYQMYHYMDIDEDEQGFTMWGSSPSHYLSDNAWLDNMHAIQYLLSLGHGYFSINQEPVKFDQVTDAQVQWALANYLLVKSAASYLYICGVQEYGYLLIRQEYSAQIGVPIQSMYASQDVYQRGFTHGLALVNPSSSHAYVVSLPDPHHDLYGHMVGSQVMLPPHSGLVLLNG